MAESGAWRRVNLALPKNAVNLRGSALVSGIAKIKVALARTGLGSLAGLFSIRRARGQYRSIFVNPNRSTNNPTAAIERVNISPLA